MIQIPLRKAKLDLSNKLEPYFYRIDKSKGRKNAFTIEISGSSLKLTTP